MTTPIIHDTRYDAFELLRNPIRLRVLHELARSDEPVGVEELVTAVQRRETGRSPAVPSEPPDDEAVRTALHHVHLPKFADAGWIEYDPENRLDDYEVRATKLVSALHAAEQELEALRTAVENRSVEG